jgi:dTDP-4-dehydrorhamnose 3,5-epimerase
VRFQETPLQGAYVVQPEPSFDERGYFARVWCSQEFAAHGLNTVWVQSSVSFNETALTLRGMHYQVAPHGEAKLVRCTSGSVFDVIIDLRADSATFLKWFSLQLDPQSNLVLYVPQGFAHGFLTLEERSVVEYHMSDYHEADCARGVRWDDATFGIDWPSVPAVMSDRDRTYLDFEDSR